MMFLQIIFGKHIFQNIRFISRNNTDYLELYNYSIINISLLISPDMIIFITNIQLSVRRFSRRPNE